MSELPERGGREVCLRDEDGGGSHDPARAVGQPDADPVHSAQDIVVSDLPERELPDRFHPQGVIPMTCEQLNDALTMIGFDDRDKNVVIVTPDGERFHPNGAVPNNGEIVITVDEPH